MTRAVLWDSSAILALLDADDVHHTIAVGVARKLAVEKRQAFITNYVEAEAHALLLRKLGRAIAREWLCSESLPVVRALPDEEQHAKALLVRYKDKDWTLCDATSFAVLEHRRIRTAFTFDHHFQQYGRFEILGLATQP